MSTSVVIFGLFILYGLLNDKCALAEASGDLKIFGTELHSGFKCCKQNEILNQTVNGTSYECIENQFKTSYIRLPIGCKNNEVCVDEILNSNSIIKINCTNFEKIEELSVGSSLAKCCPENKVYNRTSRNCVNKSAGFDFFKYFNVLNKYSYIGLPRCNKVILDTFVKDLNGIEYKSKSIRVKSKGASYTDGNYCVDSTTNEDYVIRICETDIGVCKSAVNDLNKVSCFKKCCPDGQSFKVKSKCFPTYSYGYNFSHHKIKDSKGEFATVQPENCAKYVAKENIHAYHIDEAGMLHRKEKDVEKVYRPYERSYCMEYVENSTVLSPNGYYIFFCADTSSASFLSRGICLIISAVFLFLTVLGYLILPELRNLYGKTLVCYCSSLLVAYVCLSIALLDQDDQQHTIGCKVLGYFIVFTFLAAFAWLNVMCFDIWFTFGGIRSVRVPQRQKDMKKFLWYSLYAWLLPLIITILIVVVNAYTPFPDKFIPLVGEKQCFLDTRKDTYGHLIFFRAPVAIIIAVNCYFFISTTYYCIKVKNEINKMKDSTSHDKRKKFNADKERFIICLKLFIVMGLFWIMEVITALVDFKRYTVTAYIEEIFDYLNALQGVFIFLIYMLKKNVFRSIKKKLGVLIPGAETETETSVLTSSSTLLDMKNGGPARKISTNATTKI